CVAVWWSCGVRGAGWARGRRAPSSPPASACSSCAPPRTPWRRRTCGSCASESRLMRQSLTIAARDLRATYVSAFGLGCTAAFAALSGVLLVFDLRGNQARLDLWFSALFVALAVLAALLTLRSFAEEERTGTLELLLTSPVRLWQVAVGKLLGVGGVLVVVAAATVACPLLVAGMGDPDP